MEAIEGLEVKLIMVGSAAVEHPLGKDRYIAATGVHYDMLAGTIEVDELDPNREPHDGQYYHMSYGVMVYNKSFMDRAGRRATFSRDLGMVDGKRRTVVYDVQQTGEIKKFIYDFDGKQTFATAYELPETEKDSFARQLNNILSVRK
jgi:hypothetical protein